MERWIERMSEEGGWRGCMGRVGGEVGEEWVERVSGEVGGEGEWGE